MKNVLLLILGLFISVHIYSQQKTSFLLSQKLNEKNNFEILKIVVLGTLKANLDSLNQYFYNHHIVKSERAKMVIQELKKASQQQKKIIRNLHQINSNFEIEHQYWITNMMTLWADKKTILEMKKIKQIARIELQDEVLVDWHKPIKMAQDNTKSVNGTESGIELINARFLWNLGYTGRGGKFMSFDTGIWQDHPAFQNRYLGKRLPIDYAWKGFDKKRPSDKYPSHHGTHTVSTVLGLDTSNNDTVGIAFNAYFIATDPIVINHKYIRSFSDLVTCYEWALDIDGNSNTTNDIPNVINNSWGVEYNKTELPDQSYICDGYFGDVLNAIEIAGIVNIFSAGNSGPTTSSIGFPANKNQSLVEAFSVGAIDAEDINLEIASFSSRGPSLCVKTGKKSIKPEVVAPGVNVRGATRNNINREYIYQQYSGTSMAAPHVSGLSLLLLEAFPQASAEEIKTAIYVTAQDLGDLGEDNTYGNGVINAKLAFQHLEQSYTPSTPNNSIYDLSIEGCNLDTLNLTCESKHTPIVKIASTQNFQWSDVKIEYGIYGEKPQIYHFTQAPSSEYITLNELNITKKNFTEFYAKISNLSIQNEIDSINNKWVSHFFITSSETIPFLEKFENSDLYRSRWYVYDFDEDISFDTARVMGLNGRVSAAAVIPMYRSYFGQSHKDAIISPNLLTPNSGSLTLEFDLAYNYKVTVYNDSLFVMISTDCGNIWHKVYAKGKDQLLTDLLGDGKDWVPTSQDHWRKETVDLNQYVGSGEIQVKFETKNKKGGNLYIDNISIYGDTGPLKNEENKNKTQNFKIIPNPTYNELRVFSEHYFSKFIVDIYSLNGRKVFSKMILNNEVIKLNNISKGLYFVKIKTKTTEEVKKLIIY